MQEDTRHDHVLEEENSVTLPNSWPEQGRISYVDVRLRYHRDSPLALNGLSLDIMPGQKLGICGRTGKVILIGLACLSQFYHLCGSVSLMFTISIVCAACSWTSIDISVSAVLQMRPYLRATQTQELLHLVVDLRCGCLPLRLENEG